MGRLLAALKLFRGTGGEPTSQNLARFASNEHGSPQKETVVLFEKPVTESLPLLHIDDSPNERQLVKVAILQTHTPFDFFEAAGMESAIAHFRVRWAEAGQKRYPATALVLLDYDLGDHTGVDFLYWLRLTKRNTSTPVIILSSSVGELHVEECYEIGASQFLNKPKSMARLKIIVRTLHAGLLSHEHPNPISFLQEYRADPRAKNLKTSQPA